MNEQNITKIEHGILEAYKNTNSSSYSFLKWAFAKFYSISDDGIQKFAKQLNGVMIWTLDKNLKGYLCYKIITSQNVSSNAQDMNFFIS